MEVKPLLLPFIARLVLRSLHKDLVSMLLLQAEEVNLLSYES